MDTRIVKHFTAEDVIAIIESGFRSNLDQLSIGELHLKYKSPQLEQPFRLEASLPVVEETPHKDQQPSLDDGSLMITDPLKYEELQAMEG